MTLPEILLLALGLAMDAAAVAASRGMMVPRIRPSHVLLTAVLFGGFQAGMPLFGWLIGSSFGSAMEAVDHWIAFGLLSAIGAKMIWDARHDDGGAPKPDGDPFGLRTMLILAVATSIDALAAGVTLPLVGAPMALSVTTIGLTAAALSVAGLYAGRRLGAALGHRLDILGGCVLIGLGIKTLVEHL